jgi:hypothetical protein
VIKHQTLNVAGIAYKLSLMNFPNDFLTKMLIQTII